MHDPRRQPRNPFIRYPLYFTPPTFAERLMVRARGGLITCLVCGTRTWMRITSDNLRETCICGMCGGINRQRQIAYVMLHSLAGVGRIRSLRDAYTLGDLVVYNTEARGALHAALSAMRGYVCSEYFGPAYRSGELVNNVQHQDLMQLSFADNSVDVAISSDVWEHIADPYQAHREMYRVLKPGGRHIFTIPFWEEDFLDDQRAVVKHGQIEYLRQPIYHEDPVSLTPEGALVYNIFALEMIVKLAQIGFKTNMFLIYEPKLGIIGPNGIVFEAIKGYQQQRETLGL